MTVMSVPKYPCQGIIYLPLSLDSHVQTDKGVLRVYIKLSFLLHVCALAVFDIIMTTYSCLRTVSKLLHAFTYPWPHPRTLHRLHLHNCFPVFKVSPVISHLSCTFSKAYDPCECLSIDKTMIKSKGHAKSKVCMPKNKSSMSSRYTVHPVPVVAPYVTS